MVEEEPLTAAEGADRVAKRYRRKSKTRGRDVSDESADAEEDENSTPHYTCENCGSHVFLFIRSIDERRTVHAELGCSCGATDIAAMRVEAQTRTWTLVGRLDAEHSPDYDDEEHGERAVENEEWEELESGFYCEECFREACSGDWETEELEEWEEIEESEYAEVRCAECDHEIEFGYSHLEGGRIWPCESSDFNPWLTWPEQRFIESWKRRGWLRPQKERPRK